jgi:hypothetical protein
MAPRDLPPVPDIGKHEFANRRSHVRVDVLGQVEVHSVWRLKPVFLRELSETGFSLETTSPFETGLVHKFRIGLEGQKKSTIVQATAIHCKLQTITTGLPIYIVGFKLFEPTEAVRREMKALVQFSEAMWQEPDADENIATT